MSLKSFFSRPKVVSLPTVAKSPVIDRETVRRTYRETLHELHREIVMARAGLVLRGEKPAANETERWERARAAVAILQRAV